MFLFIIKFMSLPTSKILKASKSIMAIAELKHNSPNTQQAQNVNITINPAYADKKVAYPSTETETQQQQATPTQIMAQHNTPQETQTSDNPYAGLPNESHIVNTRDIETAMKKTEEISESIEEKENTIKALSLIIEIIQNNPLIVNKYVVAEIDTLAELIRLLTNSESVEIDTNDIECSCSKANYRVIKRIYIKKDSDVYGISQCPILLRLFDNYKISLNLVI